MRKILRRLKASLPPSVRRALRSVYHNPTSRRIRYAPLDLIHWLRRSDDLTPPPSLRAVGDGDFQEIGEEFKRYFVTLGRLQPNDAVLDIGCGVGRMAIPLTTYLAADAAYWGFDIVEKGIDWCRKHITPRFTNFRFCWFDLYNKTYNPNGSLLAHEFRFPFGDAQFDFLFLTSVFTHMLPPGLENYLSEVSRVLRPGATCLATFFLLNGESTGLIREGSSSLDFRFPLGECWTTNPHSPEDALAYSEASVRALFAKYSLAITDPIYWGSWCGRTSFLSYQDIVIAARN